MDTHDLTARMLTCAAYIRNNLIEGSMTTQRLLEDAGSLLIEAAAVLEDTSVLEKLDPPPEPMEIIKPLPPRSGQTFVDPGVAPRNHPISKNACPGCDSRAIKTVHRVDNWLELECPVCGTRWKYSNIRKAKWV